MASSPQKRIVRSAAPWLALGGGLFLGTLVVFRPVREVLAAPAGVPSWEAGDLDTALIMAGLRRAPHPVDTLRWWAGPWVGIVPFYRPLSSLLFWVEWRLLGEREALYALPAAAAHVIAVALFALLVFRLASRTPGCLPLVASLVGALTFSGLLPGYRRVVVGQAFALWKNQPDTAAAIACFLALLAYLRAQERSSPGIGAAGGYLAACGFKEVALALPGVCLALELDRLRGAERGIALRRLALLVGAGLLFLAVRTLALRGAGYFAGSYGAWLERGTIHLLGPFGPIVQGAWLGGALALWTLAVALAARRAWCRARLLLATLPLVYLVGGGVLGYLAVVRTADLPWGEASVVEAWVAGLGCCLQPPVPTHFAGALLLLGAVSVLLRSAPSGLAVGVLWVVAFALPQTMAAGRAHRDYLPDGGFFLLYALAAGVAIGQVRARFARPRGEATSCA